MQVSILTGPFGPVQRPWGVRTTHHSSPGFNPHRPLRAGATRPATTAPPPGGRRVSILTGPFGPVQRAPAAPGAAPPPGFNPHRPLRAGATRSAMDWICRSVSWFQSSPAPSGRCNLGRPVFPLTSGRGVSILTGPFGPVQHRVGRRRVHPHPVSILTGPFGPVQRGLGPPRGSHLCPRFNPHRPLRAGATGAVVPARSVD